ncbi:hypothetical protein BFJ63_vAg13346 [Fusarium oxysporum f. sp. narcissi]|uniref:Tc toxin complex TcA C-terminal TcB-binding domain-containing protein n=1 Tax=Fusarium oxysporum f. sp. narcissi TaxID=451672 RepID=A0A4V1RZ40_FUSOX|nr:hypothetical protein NW765_010050 [Fusarium oxysporum]KAJ4276718.1 hypothetical protein NW764_009130 [Fusarium oxysporum]RYC83776.1 hypothetical protein BFJ63_vAg13346 [Fusarium oxysporum f. sp. narcissi]
MEAAYLERPSYDYEIVKSISFRQLNPEALLNLRANGNVTFDIPEVLYDFDFPGHYMRRIKSVSLSVPCVVGPYTGLNATLRLLQHRDRVSSVAASGEDYAGDGMASGHFRTDIAPITSVAISLGIQDSGVFELNFKDDHFQPFKGAGAIGSWSQSSPRLFVLSTTPLSRTLFCMSGIQQLTEDLCSGMQPTKLSRLSVLGSKG